jgi:hypothetical protein
MLGFIGYFAMHKTVYTAYLFKKKFFLGIVDFFFLLIKEYYSFWREISKERERKKLIEDLDKKDKTPYFKIIKKVNFMFLCFAKAYIVKANII